MLRKKWWIWVLAAAFLAAAVIGISLYTGRDEPLPRGTLVKMVQEEISYE